MRCPRDHHVVRSITQEHITFEMCPVCGGLWLERTEFESIARMCNAGESVDQFAQKHAECSKLWEQRGANTERVLVECPHDGHGMRVMRYAGDSGVLLDQCDHCGGFWLDGDEILRIHTYLSPGQNKLLAEKLLARELVTHDAWNEQAAALPMAIAQAFQSPGALMVFVVWIVRSLIEHALRERERNEEDTRIRGAIVTPTVTRNEVL